MTLSAKSHRTARTTRMLAAGAVLAGGLIAAPAASAATPVDAPVPAGSQVLLLDDFSSLNKTTWQAAGPGRGTGGGVQTYSPSAVDVHDGELTLTASRGDDGRWTSGRVDLNTERGETSGLFEARVRVPAGQGLQPSVRLLGADTYTGTGWPNAGEVNVAEAVGGVSSVTGGVHGGGDSGHWQVKRADAGVDPSQWHTYGVDVEASSVTWYVDGVEQARFSRDQLRAGDDWPFADRAFVVVLQLGVGGPLAGAPTPATSQPASMEVDWVSITR